MEPNFGNRELTDSRIAYAVKEFEKLVYRVRRHAKDDFVAALVAQELLIVRNTKLELKFN